MLKLVIPKRTFHVVCTFKTPFTAFWKKNVVSKKNWVVHAIFFSTVCISLAQLGSVTTSRDSELKPFCNFLQGALQLVHTSKKTEQNINCRKIIVIQIPPPPRVSAIVCTNNNLYSHVKVFFLSITQNMGVNKQEHRKKILRSIKSLCGGLPPSTALLIDRTEHGNRLKIKNLDIEKDFDSQ